MDSPTGVRATTDMWWDARTTPYISRPRIGYSVLPTGRGFLIWLMVFWHTDVPIRGALNPDSFHTTLVRAITLDWWTSREDTARLLDMVRMTLQEVLELCMEGRGPYVLNLYRTPWRNSWAFSPDPDTTELLLLLRMIATRALRVTGRFHVHEHRELHTSYP